MGQEIHNEFFSSEDSLRFARILENETNLLQSLFEKKSFSCDHGMCGFELEAWLVEKKFDPAPLNNQFLINLCDPTVCAELAMFNIEINAAPHQLEGEALSNMHRDLDLSMEHCVSHAADLDAGVVMVGILPTVEDRHLIPSNMSDMKRYRAINDRLLAMRSGTPFSIEIEGEETLSVSSQSVMFEAATTALQLQLQVDFRQSTRFYNAALVLSAPCVALTANSPFMFGRDLWRETRIPLFEQSVAGLSDHHDLMCSRERVTMGRSYVKESLFEIFRENLDCFMILLPMVFDDAKPEEMVHLRLHNGTIWRWNRPLVGFCPDGSPHLRIEHRVSPSGPTCIDIIANAAFFFGLIQSLATMDKAPESMLSFDKVIKNFYNAARVGLDCKIEWFNGASMPVSELILKHLIPMAKEGLLKLGVTQSDASRYLEIIECRVRSGQNGADWQRRFVKEHNASMKDLCEVYYKNQISGAPVHEWKI